MTTPKIREVEYSGEPSSHGLPENVTLTAPLPESEIAQAISDVVARVDEDYALDLVTVLQIKARFAEDTGERITLDEFAEQEGWAEELARLRSE